MLATYIFTEKVDQSNFIVQRKLKSKFDGEVLELLVNPNDEVKKGYLYFYIYYDKSTELIALEVWLNSASIFIIFYIYWWHCSWRKTHIFSASTITTILTQSYNYYNFFSDNATIVYWMEETSSCLLRIASKAPVRTQQNLYNLNPKSICEWPSHIDFGFR